MREFVNYIPFHLPVRISRKYLLHLAASLWVVLSLVGCSGLGGPPVTEESYASWARHQVLLSKLDSWDVHARAVVFVEHEVYQVGINWQRESDHFDIVIEAPFGRGVFRIESNLQANAQPPVKLSLPDGQVFYGHSAEALLIRAFGWSLPVTGLESWIKGLPLADTDYSFDLQADGRLKTLRQDDWVINYLDYFQRDTTTQGLPRKMYLKHANLALKIVIERWRQFESEIKSPVLFPDFD